MKSIDSLQKLESLISKYGLAYSRIQLVAERGRYFSREEVKGLAKILAEIRSIASEYPRLKDIVDFADFESADLFEKPIQATPKWDRDGDSIVGYERRLVQVEMEIASMLDYENLSAPEEPQIENTKETCKQKGVEPDDPYIQYCLERKTMKHAEIAKAYKDEYPEDKRTLKSLKKKSENVRCRQASSTAILIATKAG